jgi:diacylglycerol kinase
MIPPLAFNVANVAIVAAILYGVAVHAHRIRHARIMITCFVADLLVVLLIELQRSAIDQAVHSTSGLMRFHVAVSVAALILWVPQIITGRAILRGKPRLRRHRIQAWIFLLCRGTNLVTAFMVSP